MTVQPLQISPCHLPEGPTFYMVHIEGGAFYMGDNEGNHDDEKPAHEVQVNSFQLGQYPVTQALWEAVMGENPAYFKGSNRPVEQVSWYDAVEFCNALSKRLDLEPVYQIDKTQKDSNSLSDYDDVKWVVTPNWQAKGFRLPTEAEWEYAASGGGVFPFGRMSPSWRMSPEYSGSNHLNQVGWYDDNSQNQTHAVGLKAPNALGLYDMSGNVREWCWNWYDGGYYQTCAEKGIAIDPKGPGSGRYRVLRGGSWDLNAVLCRVAYRRDYHPDLRLNYIGLRLSRTVS